MTVINAREKEQLISEITADDTIVFRSVTCTHNHTRRHEYEESGITTTASYQEAIAGGITSSFGMPNTKPALTRVALLDEFFAQGADLPGYRYIHFGVRDDNIEECEKALADPRVVGLKIYPAERSENGDSKVVTTSFDGLKAEVCDNIPVPGRTLYELAKSCIKHKKPMIIHCETPGMGHDPDAEEHYIQHTIVPLCKGLPNLTCVIAHTSLLSTVQTIVASNKRFDTNFYMELTPHHLWWTENDIADNFLECYPRLRSKHDRDGLLDAFSKIGTDPAYKFMHGTDHAPHTIDAKQAGSRGIPNLRDSVAVCMTLAERCGMTTTQMQLFFRGVAQECYPFLKDEEHYYTKVVKKEYTPDNTYYGGAVHNPFGSESLGRMIES